MKKIVSLILSLVMLLSITSGLNLTAYADDVNHYLDFQAEIYSSETAGFDNIFVGTDSSSFSRTLYNNLKNDTKFQVTLAAWSSTHIVDDATYTIENNVFKKKDLYDAILFDMIDSTDESTLCQQYQNEFEKLYKMVKNERSSYVIKTTDMILGKENYTVEQLKTTDLSEDAKDLLLNGTKYAGVTSVISEVNKILGNVKNAYDAINAVADYLAIKDVDCGTSEILNEIASDSQSPIELRYSAAEISDCMAGAYGKTAALIAEGSISGIEFALNKAINYAWDSVLACIPGGTAISFGAKTGRMLVNYFFKTETVIQGYYQLEAAVNIEDAIIRVMQNKKNADTGYTNIDSAVYMKSVDMYKDIILLGFDYSIELLQNAANSDFNTATDFWLGNYSQCMQLIDQIQELKQKKIDNFVKYEEIVFNKYKSLYLPNYDELEDEISKTVPVTALSVTQLVDINIGDSAYFEDCFAYNFEPYNYTESVTNVSVTSSDSNIISVVKGDDSKEKFVANNAGTCTLTFTLNDRITCQKEVTVKKDENRLPITGKCGFKVTYSLDTLTGVLTISGTGDMYGYLYGSTKSPFFDNSNVKSVIIENGVTSIGGGMFLRCANLTSVTIPNSLTTIGEAAFYSCTNLTNVKIPNSVTTINKAAFYSCTNLTSLTIPDSITNIGSDAFAYCRSLTSVTIPNSVKSIGEHAFEDCTSLTSIGVSSDNENYASVEGVLFNKDKSKLITYPAGKSNDTYEISNSVTSIGDHAFTGCVSLKSVTIYDSVTSISDGAFFDCEGLKDVYYTSTEDEWNKITIGNDNENLTNATIHYNFEPKPSNKQTGSCGDNVTYSLDTETGVLTISGTGKMKDYSGEDSPFYQNSNIKSVIIENGVTSIGNLAFSSCNSLIEVSLPSSIISLGVSAFSGCENLMSISIPANVADIQSIAFAGCKKLTSIEVDSNNENYSSINGVLFDKNITELVCYPAGKNDASYTVPNTVKSFAYGSFYDCENLTSVIIPNGVTSIGGASFWNCKNLKSIVIPKSVTKIDLFSFNGCESLKDIYYTGTQDEWNNITIGDGNINLTSATIHYNFEPCTENQHNYYGEWKIIEEPTCTKAGLKQKTCSFDGYVQKEEIPAKGHTEVVINGYAATCEKSGLTDGKKCSVCGEVLEAQKEIPKLDHSYIKTVVEPTCTEQGYTIYKCETCGETYKDDYVKAKGHDFSNNAQFCLNGCGKVNPNYVAPDTSTVQTGSCGDNVIYSLNTETGVLTISGTGEMTGSPFSQNSSIKSVIIENGVTSIVTYAFSGCTSLTSITISDSVTSIGESAFDGCTSLVSVTLSKSITTIEYSTFFGCSSLTSIEIPKSVTTIVNFAFCGCTNLKDVYYDGTQSEWNKINIGHSNECLTNASLHCSLTPTPEPTPTPTPEPTPTPNPAPQPSTQPTQETQQQAAQQTAQQPSVKNDTAAEQVSVAKPKSVSPKKVKSAKKAVSVEWKKVGGVKGYQIQVATDKKFKKNKKTVTIKKQKTTKTTVKKLKAKKKYYVRVRTYKIVNGKKVYSSWSKVKSVKTK